MDITVAYPRQKLPFKSKGENKIAERPCLVYTLTNMVNGHVYVGVTYHVENPRKRWARGLGYKKNSRFYRAICKYGWDSFSQAIELYNSRLEAYARERELIKYYKLLGISYNLSDGGDGAESVSEETKEKLRQYTPWIKGKHHTEAAKRKISEAGMGRKMSEYNKEKLREANRNRAHIVSDEHIKRLKELRGRPVLQIDKKTNEIIAEYPSAIEAERHFGKIGSRCGHINQVCNGMPKRKTCYGFKWSYK